MIKLPGKDGPGMVRGTGGGLGSGGSGFGSGPSSDFALLQEGERRLASVEAQARARVDLQSVFDRVEREVTTAPEAADAKALGDLYTNTVRTVRDETVKTIPDPEDQDAFVRRFGDHAMRRLGPLTDRLNAARKTQATARLEQTLSNIAGALTLEEDGEEMDRLVQDGLGAIDGFAGSLPAEDRAALKKGFHHKLAEAEFTKLLQDDPAEAREAIARGAFSDMDQTLQDQWKRRAHHAAAARGRDAPRTEAAARRAEAEARTKEQLAAYTDLARRIDEGEAGFAEIDAAFADGEGMLSVGQNRRLVARVEAKAEKNKQVAEATDRIGALIADGTSLTEEHDRDLGLVFDETIGKCHPDMTADQGRMVLMFAEQTRRIPGPCLEPIWRCFEKGPASKAGPCAGFLHRIGSIEGLELPVPDHLRPTFDGFQQMIDAGWSLTEALEKQREEAGIPGLRTLEHHGNEQPVEPRNTIARPEMGKDVLKQIAADGSQPAQSTSTSDSAPNATTDANPDTVSGNAGTDTLIGGEGDDLIVVEGSGEDTSAFEHIREQAEHDLHPENLPREDLAKKEGESWDEWGVRIYGAATESKDPSEQKEISRRFHGELLKEENSEILAAAMQGVSIDAYRNPIGDPVTGPDLEELKQWQAENPELPPSEAPLFEGQFSYLASDGNYYWKDDSSSARIGRHSRLLQGEMEGFTNHADVELGEYGHILMEAAAGAFVAGAARKRPQGLGKRSFKKFRRMFDDETGFKETKQRVDSGIPLGFKNRTDVASAIAPTRDSLNKLGLTPDKAQIGIMGSSVTGRKYVQETGKYNGPAFGKRSGAHDSDHDYFIVSPDLYKRAKELGVEQHGGGTRTKKLDKSQLDELGISLPSKNGYNRDIVIYRDTNALDKRGPHILFERGE